MARPAGLGSDRIRNRGCRRHLVTWLIYSALNRWRTQQCQKLEHGLANARAISKVRSGANSSALVILRARSKQALARQESKYPAQGAGNQADCLTKMPAIFKRILRAHGYTSGQGSGAEQNFPVDRSESRSEGSGRGAGVPLRLSSESGGMKARPNSSPWVQIPR